MCYFSKVNCRLLENSLMKNLMVSDFGTKSGLYYVGLTFSPLSGTINGGSCLNEFSIVRHRDEDSEATPVSDAYGSITYGAIKIPYKSG